MAFTTAEIRFPAIWLAARPSLISRILLRRILCWKRAFRQDARARRGEGVHWNSVRGEHSGVVDAAQAVHAPVYQPAVCCHGSKQQSHR